MPPSAPRLSGFQPDPLLAQLPGGVQVYVVGGAVRDELLGRPSADRDWVVVGTSPEALQRLGFKPVGADFPVFLHPHTQDEYALARTERKSGVGYKGFTFFASPEVTLEQDLARRDFTLNAMAMAANGSLIDPFDGLSDLRAGVMRHVSPAFSEDPLRILRLARFLARFDGFQVAPETQALCDQLVASGELQHLVPERVFAELHKGMGEVTPSRMLQLLTQLKAWSSLLEAGLPWPFGAWGPGQHQQLDGLGPAAAALSRAEARWVYAFGLFLNEPALRELAQALRWPAALLEHAQVACRVWPLLKMESPGLDPDWAANCLPLLTQVDVFRKPERLLAVLNVLAQVEPALGTTPRFLHLQQAAQSCAGGHYKTTLRDYMQAHAGGNPAELAAQFKSVWVSMLLKA